MFQNYVIMSNIITNHYRNVINEDNPLKHTTSIKTFKFVQFLNFNFGYHAEHHLFPEIPSSKIKKIHLLLKSEYPEDYNYEKKTSVIKKIYF